MSNEFNNYLTKIHKNFTLVKKDFKKHKFTLKEGFITFTVDLKNINCSMCNTKDLNICSLKKCSHIYRLFNELYNVPNDKLHFLWLNDNYKSILEKKEMTITDNDIECPICYEDATIKKNIHCLDCGKFYHVKCLEKSKKGIVCLICTNNWKPDWLKN